MTKPDATPRKAAARRKRVSRLNSAILRIGGSLDIDTVLREAVEGARDLTGARFAAVATADENGNALDYVTSGLTEEQRGALAGWSAGTRFFEHLRGREGPLRLADFPAYAKSLGFPADPIPCKNFQGMPMRHRGAHVGNFFLGGKKDKGAFTDADEEMLVLFASQAAATVSNALTHRDERRARADLEALVETSPVGVVVFSVADGRVLMVNRESRRIVASLHIPGLELPELAATLTCRRGDGREITLADIANAETLRAEEVELSLPDGRNVRMLISATPTRSPAGEVLSMIVTMQDLAPLEALERSRAEFLGMVSHELRAPLAAIKGSAAMVADATRTYDPAELLQFFRIVDTEANRMDSLIGDLLDVGRIDTGTLTVDPAPVELGPLVDRARSTFVSSRGRQTLHIDLPPDLPRVAADQRRIAQVLDNLISNASRHSPDSAPIRIAASRKDGFVEVSVTDGGKGLPQNELSRLFRKRAGVRGDRAGGTGLGLAICKGLVEAHGGRIRADSGGPGCGMRFSFTLPVVDPASEVAAGLAVSSPTPSAGGLRPASILVVDDDPQTTRYVRDALSAAGYAPVATGDPEEVPRLILEHAPDLVLMDLMLPGTDGIELMQDLPELASLPVIFISAYGRDETVARALDAGARDYIVKPFSPTELTARVGAALRGKIGAGPFMLGNLAIDYERRRVTVAGEQVKLTATEFDLLRALSTSGDRVLTYDALLRRVWGGSKRGGSALVRTFVKKLRRKLGDSATSPTYILNERGVGYRMAGPGEV